LTIYNSPLSRIYFPSSLTLFILYPFTNGHLIFLSQFCIVAIYYNYNIHKRTHSRQQQSPGVHETLDTSRKVKDRIKADVEDEDILAGIQKEGYDPQAAAGMIITTCKRGFIG